MPVRPMATMTIVVATAVATLAGCGSDGSTPLGQASSTSTTPSSTSTTTAPPVSGGRTDWVDVTAKWKALAPNAFAMGPEAVAEDLAALRRGGDTSEVGRVGVASVQRGEPLRIVIVERDVADDSILQVDTELTLEGSDEGWVLVGARAQYVCRRSLTEGDPTTCA